MGLNSVAFVLMIIATLLFVVAFFIPPYATRLFSLAAAVLTVALIIQFGAKHHTVTFG